MGLDEELWDILEDGVGDLDLGEEGVVVDDGYALKQAAVSGQEKQEILEQKKWLQRLQERRSEGLLQLQEAWTFRC